MEHRGLRFGSIDDLEAELARVEEAEREGRLVACGKWTAGQVLNHLGAWIEFGYEGYPGELRRPPLAIRVMLRVMKRGFLRRPLPVGFRIPGAPEGTFGVELVGFEAGLSRLGRNLERLKRGEAPAFASPAFGALRHREAVALTLRHAELHLGFLKY